MCKKYPWKKHISPILKFKTPSGETKMFDGKLSLNEALKFPYILFSSNARCLYTWIFNISTKRGSPEAD